MLRLLAILGTTVALRVITRSMIRTPADQGLPVEYQPVPLRTRATEEPQAMARSLEVTALPTSLYQEDRAVTSLYQEDRALTAADEDTTTPIPPVQEVAPRRTTILRPVSGLWQDRQLLEPDIWGIIRTAYYCLFSGYDCFSSRVFPLVKSFIGYQPHYPYPRSLPIGGRGQELLKELVVGAALVSLPWVGGLGVAAGRALASGLLALVANGNNYYM